MKVLMLSQNEQARLETLNRVLEGQLRAREAAMVLRVSERHTWRMLARTDGRELLPSHTAIEVVIQELKKMHWADGL